MSLVVIGSDPPDAKVLELIQFAKDRGIEIVYQQPMTISFPLSKDAPPTEPWRDSPKRDKYKKQ